MINAVIQPIKTPALGDTSYLVTHGATAIVIDPQRDIARYRSAIDGLDADLAAVVETHVHNDYVSGGPELARAGNARMIVPAGAAPSYRSEPAFHREAITIGAMTLTPLHTPGHTPEHTSYVLSIDGADLAVFSGGSLLIGAAGRSDLLGAARAETLARLQFRSLRTLAELASHVEVHPTHGPGSFCAAGTGGSDSSTIGQEIRTNPVLQIDDADTFVQDQLSGLPSYPDYYRHMAPINLQGGAPMPPAAQRLRPDEVASLLESSTIIDTRKQSAFAEGHIRGSMWIGVGDSFASWVGWLTEIGDQIILITASDEIGRDLQVELSRIGYDRLAGWMVGVDQWSETGGDVDVIELAHVDRWLTDPPEQTLDVRDAWERAIQPLDGAVEIFLPEIDETTAKRLDRTRPVGVVCQSGYRASIAGSLLKRLGYEPVVLANGGVPDLAATPST